MVLETGWLIVMAVGMAAWVRNDTAQYRSFKGVEDSAVRRAFYRRWTAQSFVVLVGASLVSLWLAGNLGAALALPAAFAPLAAMVHPSASPELVSDEAMHGMVIGMTASILIGVAVQYFRLRRLVTPVVGDIEPLLPRNGREMLWALPLSLNAGFSEELFFRCALPLLLAGMTGSAIAAFAIAGIAFGLVHAYQGWKGVVATTMMGGLLTLAYLSSGSLLRVMVIHALIDVVALIVRPALSRLIAARRPVPATA